MATTSGARGLTIADLISHNHIPCTTDSMDEAGLE